MKPLLLSLAAAPPPGFSPCADPPVPLLRRGVFCLHGAGEPFVERRILPHAERLAGIVVVAGDAASWREAGPNLWILACPAAEEATLAARLAPMLDLIARAIRGDDLARALAADAERACRDRADLAREHLAFREGIYREIEERRRAEMAARESRDRLGSVIAHAPVVFFVTDAAGRFTLSEGRGLSRLGLHPGEVVGRTVDEVYREFPQILACMARALAGDPVREDIAVGPLVFDTLFSPLQDDAGGLSGVIGVATDITDRRRAETERLDLERQMLQAQKLESLGVLAGGVAHDFNNLLTSVLANASLALLDLPPANPARENLRDIETAARRAAELCRQLLAYSGRGRFVVAPVRLSDTVREMVELLTLSISKGAKLDLSLDERIPPVDADATQLRQVVMNLVLNAAESLHDGEGTIRVAVRPTRLSYEEILAGVCPDESTSPGEFVTLEVADDGGGMDDETRRRIFEPFFTTKFQGRGLGLAAVLGIVRGHRGVLAIESSPGSGTTFRIHLPAATDADRAGQEPACGGAAPFRGAGEALLVDDEEAIRVPGKRMLERLGFTVRVARDGVEALDLFRARRDAIRLVLLDLTMPRMPGDRAFRELRAIDPRLPVIMMSGYSENDFATRFPDGAPDAFLQKPFDLPALEAVCRLAFRARG